MVVDVYCHVCRDITPLTRAHDRRRTIRCGTCWTELREEARFAAPVEEPPSSRVRRNIEGGEIGGAYRSRASRPTLRLDLLNNRGEPTLTIGAVLFLGLFAAASLWVGDFLFNLLFLPFIGFTASVFVSGELERSTVWVDGRHVRSVTQPLGAEFEVLVSDITGVFVDQELTALQSISSVVLVLEDGSEVSIFRSSAPNRAHWLAWAIAHHLGIRSTEPVQLRVGPAISEAAISEAETEAEAEATATIDASPDQREEP